jgi:hypothetical protein
VDFRSWRAFYPTKLKGSRLYQENSPPECFKICAGIAVDCSQEQNKGIADPEANLGPVGGSSFHRAAAAALGLIGKESP